MAIYTINQKAVICTFGNAVLKGFADGETISIANGNDAWATKTGLDGMTTRTKRNDDSVVVTCNIKQVAPVNLLLNSYYQIDRTTGLGVFPFSVTDIQGGLSVLSGAAFIMALPETSYSEDEPVLAWRFFLDNALINFTGGILSLGV